MTDHDLTAYHDPEVAAIPAGRPPDPVPFVRPAYFDGERMVPEEELLPRPDALGPDESAPIVERALAGTHEDASPDNEDDLFLSPAQVYEGAPPVESVVPGIAAHGALTNIDGKPKAGKTTFVLLLVAAGLHPDRRFLGHQVEFDVVIYLTEQGRDSLKEQLAIAGIGRDVAERVEIVEWAAVAHLAWPDVLALVRRRVERRYAEARVLLVVDTFSKWARTRDENDATATMDAYRPLLLLTQDLRLATIALRHGRKGDHDDVTDSARGSNAASGEADIILHLSKPEGRPGEGRSVRRLRGVGRLDGIPDDLRIEIRDGEYVVLAEGEEYQSAQHRTTVYAALEYAADALDLERIMEATSLSRTRVQAALAELMHPTSRTVERHGAGRRGDPYRYTVSARNPVLTTAAESVPGVSAHDSPPVTPTQFGAPSHAQNGPDEEPFRAESDFRPELPRSTHARDISPRLRVCPSCHQPHPVGTFCSSVAA